MILLSLLSAVHIQALCRLLCLRFMLHCNGIPRCFVVCTLTVCCWDEDFTTGYLRQYSVSLPTGWPGFDPRQGQRIFLVASASRPALGPTKPPVQWVPGVVSPGVKRGRGVMLTTHPHLVPRLRMIWSCTYSAPQAPPLRVAGQLYFLLLLHPSAHAAACYVTYRRYWSEKCA
jgi:hypothetical protein